jgi:hypothetical protein
VALGGRQGGTGGAHAVGGKDSREKWLCISYTLETHVPAMDQAADTERERDTMVSSLQGKIATGDFDVFLCHNSADKPAVRRIGEQLKEYGLLPWLDEWELRPGFSWQKVLEE